MKNAIVTLGVFGVFLGLAPAALAYSITTDPPAGDITGTSVTVHISGDFTTINDFYTGNPISGPGFCIGMYGFLTNPGGETDVQSPIFDFDSGDAEYTFSGLVPGGQYYVYGVSNTVTDCNSGTNFFLPLDPDATPETNPNPVDFTVLEAPENNFDFFGSSSPLQVLGSVTEGVQTTGAKMWPLFAVIGIPVAFSIAGYVASLVFFAI